MPTDDPIDNLDVTICFNDTFPGEGCQQIFPRKSSKGHCAKCEMLLQLQRGSGDYIDKETWPQCKDCGVCASRMTTERCGRCQIALNTEQKKVNAAVTSAQQVRSDAFQHRVKSKGAMLPPPPPGPLRADENPLASTFQGPQLPLNTQTINQTRQMLNGTTPPTAITRYTVHMAPRLDGKTDNYLGPNTHQYPGDSTMDAIIKDNLRSWNEQWEKKHPYSLAIQDVTLRFHSNQNPLDDTSHLSVEEFYNAHVSSGHRDIYFGKLPKTVPIIKNSKSPTLALELYIDTETYYDRTGNDAVSTTGATGKKGQRKRGSDQIDEADLKRRRIPQTGGLHSTYQHHSSYQIIDEKKTQIKLILGLSQIVAETGEFEYDWPKVGESEERMAVIGDGSYCKGATKFMYKLSYNDYNEHHVAKRFFNIGADGQHVSPDENRNNLCAELKRLKLGQWFLDRFYDHAHKMGQEVATDFEFADAVLAQEVTTAFGDPSLACGFSAEDIADQSPVGPPTGAYWLIKNRRSTHVERYSGTMMQQHARSKRHLTINAFAHFVHEYSEGNLVIVDIEATPGTLRNKQQGYILFDTMTHTLDGSSGVGDCGQEGIDTFKAQHVCQDICNTLQLNHPSVTVPKPRTGPEDDSSDEENRD
ncbi:kinase-like domain-containing protein [Amylocystis lapponica]|nr:kinase-like domain-containing protein [Amylocystis lapponica]